MFVCDLYLFLQTHPIVPVCVQVAGGRDGQLKAWDLRAGAAAVVRASSNATGGFTMGKRARDYNTGSISVLSRSSTLSSGKT